MTEKWKAVTLALASLCCGLFWGHWLGHRSGVEYGTWTGCAERTREAFDAGRAALCDYCPYQGISKKWWQEHDKPCAPDYVWVPGTGAVTPTPMVNYNGTQVYCDGTVILVTTPAPVVSGAPCYEPMQKDRQFMFRPVACPDFGAKP